MSGIELAPLRELLERQKAVYEQLLSLSYEKKQIVVKGDTDRLGQIVQDELKCLARVNSIEKKRTLTLTEIAGKIGMTADTLTLAAIMEAAGGEDRESLTKLRKELASVLRSLAEINAENQNLLETQLEYTDTMLNMFVGSEDPLNNLYGVQGRSEDDRRQSTGVCDWQA